MTTLQSQIHEKRNILRNIYGGMMTLADLSRELGMKKDAARSWATEQGIGVRIGSRIKYETDEVARRIVERRGMC